VIVLDHNIVKDQAEQLRRWRTIVRQIGFEGGPMKRFIRFSLLMLVFAFLQSGSYACSCIVPEVPEAFDQAQSVFLGEVVEIVNPSTVEADAPLPGRLYTIKFKVERSWKGFPFAEIDVLSAQGDGCFAYPAVHKGEKYLVYAEASYVNGSEDKHWLMIWSCSRTALFVERPPSGHRSAFSVWERDAAQDIRALNGMLLFPNRTKPQTPPGKELVFINALSSRYR
jgi:hypothetical protein